MRKLYLVPNLVTTGNMFCGFYSMIASMQDKYEAAAWLIVLASVFDMLDGRIARLAKATSQFGVEYDSLSDLVSFGVAPSILLYQWALKPYDRLGWLAAFLYMACGALRLARFNVSVGTVSKAFFQGLPIPMAAGIVATYIIFNQTVNWSDSRQIPALVMTFGLASLMVSTIRFPSFKELNWRSRATFGYMMIGVLTMILVAVKPEVTLFFTLAAYVVLSLVWNLTQVLQRVVRGEKAPRPI
ncbi:MAG: CDP-diacylglycerol--serine O-phosphatidyltransferase [Bdellovibrionota bacterium]